MGSHLTADSAAAAMHFSALILPLAMIVEIATPVTVERINGVMSIGEEVNRGSGAQNNYKQLNNVSTPSTYHLTSMTAQHNLVKRAPLVFLAPLALLPKKPKLLKLLKKKGPLVLKKPLLLKTPALLKLPKGTLKKSKPLLLKTPTIKKGVKGAAAVSAPVAISGSIRVNRNQGNRRQKDRNPGSGYGSPASNSLLDAIIGVL